MEGYQYRKLKPVVKHSEHIGITPRAVESLFKHLQEASAEYTVHCSHIQIYSEKLYDLLNPAQLRVASHGLKLRWNPHAEFYVENLFMHRCYTASEALSYFHSGLNNKVMAAHNLNSASSRSHCIFSLAVDSQDQGLQMSRLHLVDLAGSEKASLTGNEGPLLKESIEINKSLFTLRQVISSLSVSEAPSYVPYRDSKLTSLLKQGIGGNSYCLMIACLSPSDSYYEENLSTLLYATKAADISNEPVKNVDPKTKLLSSLKGENRELREELESAHAQLQTLTEILKLDKEEQLQELGKLGKNDSSQLSTTQVLGQKLHESLKIIRNLMNSNRKMKENIEQLQGARTQQDSRFHQVQLENQKLQEELDDLKQTLRGRKHNGSKILQLRNDNESLEKRILQIEDENAQIHSVFQKQHWRNAPTPRRRDTSLNFNIESFLPAVQSARPAEESQGLSKEDAISALSKMILHRAKSRK